MSVYCACREPQRLTTPTIPTLINESQCFFSPTELLFCTACQAVKCPFCVTKEPIIWFCMHCMAEFTKSQARSNFNRCSRSCLQCPCCPAIIRVELLGEQWHLTCHCGYKKTLNQRFSRVIDQVQEETFVEITKIKKFVDSNLIGNTTCTGPIPITDTRPVFSKKTAHIPAQETVSASKHSDSVPIKEMFIGSNSVSNTSFHTSNMSLVDSDLPRPALLRAKFTKSCKTCGQILIYPSLTPSDSNYSTKSIARSVLPSITYENKQSKLLFRNYSTYSMHLTLTCLDENEELATDLQIPAQNSEGFPAPLFHVKRETVASRQAFMAGETNSGPGWAALDVKFSKDLAFIRLYVLIKCEKNSVGVFFRVPTTTR